MPKSALDLLLESLELNVTLLTEKAEIIARQPGRRSDSAVRDLVLVWRIVQQLDKTPSVSRAAEFVARRYPDLGLNAKSARVRFAGLTNPKDRRHAGARRQMLDLFRAI